MEDKKDDRIGVEVTQTTPSENNCEVEENDQEKLDTSSHPIQEANCDEKGVSGTTPVQSAKEDNTQARNAEEVTKPSSVDEETTATVNDSATTSDPNALPAVSVTSLDKGSTETACNVEYASLKDTTNNTYDINMLNDQCNITANSCALGKHGEKRKHSPDAIMLVSPKTRKQCPIEQEPTPVHAVDIRIDSPLMVFVNA